MAPLPTQFGPRVRQLRTAKGWTILQLSFESTLTPAFLSDLELGKRKNVSMKTVVKLGRAFDKSAVSMLRGLDENQFV